MSYLVNQGRLLDRFFTHLIAGTIGDVQPRAALASDVLRLYHAWGESEGFPAGLSASLISRYLRIRHSIKSGRSRYALGDRTCGPHSIIYLAGPLRCRLGMGEELRGVQVAEFKWMVDAYVGSKARNEGFKPKLVRSEG